MTADFFIAMLFGHLIGDYLLQNKWMAMNKNGGTFTCLVHCIIYTLSVLAMTWTFNHSLLWITLIFTSHYPIDRYSLADKWLDWIGGRTLKDFIEHGQENIPGDLNVFNYHALRGGFTAFVYAISDNTLHLLIMYYGYRLL